MCVFGGAKGEHIVGKVRCMNDKLQWNILKTSFMRSGHVSRAIGNYVVHIGGVPGALSRGPIEVNEAVYIVRLNSVNLIFFLIKNFVF